MQFKLTRKEKQMYNRKYTPARIIALADHEVFVFGSNLAGIHASGAARLAYERFGAVWGKGVGLYGQSYALPTMQGGVDTIKPYVDAFIRFARRNPHLTFLVTRIGCGIARFRDADIAPLFLAAIDQENILLPKEFVDYLLSCNQPNYCFDRFLLAQQYSYDKALQEIRSGCKRTHWIWFIFPQLAEVGNSANAQYYGLSGIAEARAYLEHPQLGARLREATQALLNHADTTAEKLLGETDAAKVCSCMTLFDALSPHDIFRQVLDRYYRGMLDQQTLYSIGLI